MFSSKLIAPFAANKIQANLEEIDIEKMEHFGDAVSPPAKYRVF